MDSKSVQAARCRIDRTGDHVRREDMCRVRVRIAKEVGEGYGREGVVIGKGGLVELDHYGYKNRCICDAIILEWRVAADGDGLYRGRGRWWCDHDHDGGVGEKKRLDPGF